MNINNQEKIPLFLLNKLLEQYGEELTNSIIEGYQKKITTIRVNNIKTTLEQVIKELDNNNISYSKVSWYKNSLIINKDEKLIKELDIYKNGHIYLQSLSSMIPPLILEPKPNEIILDMAAAPGSKTTQIACLADNKSLITACEKNKNRAERLKYNLEKQGIKKTNVIIKDSRQLDNNFKFEKILLDAPCSGSGTLDINNSKLFEIFTEELVNRSAKTQLELLKKATQIITLNGEIIYSTCSILKEENEGIIKEILKEESFELIPIDETLFENIPLLPVSLKGTICIKPTKYFEGFFIAKLKKKK